MSETFFYERYNIEKTMQIHSICNNAQTGDRRAAEEERAIGYVASPRVRHRLGVLRV